MIILTIIISIIIRLIGITNIALWHDEAFSVLLSRLPLSELVIRTGLDVHPPAYYILLKWWSVLTGQSLFAFRSFSAFWGVLTIIFTYLLVKKLWPKFSKPVIGWLLLALAFAPFQVQYSQEMRMYSLGSFLAVLMAYLLLLIFKTKNTRRKIILAIILAIATITALYSHYYLLFTIAGVGLFWIIFLIKNKKLAGFKLNLWLPLGAWLVSIIAWLPWLPTFIKQLKQVQEAYWIPAPHYSNVPNTFLKLILGSEVTIQQNYWYALVVLIALGLIVYGLIKTKTFYKWLLLIMFIVPIVASLALSFKTAIYLDRYFIFAQIFYYILIWLGIVSIKRKSLRWILLLVFVITNIWGLISYKQAINAEAKPGMKAVSEYINNNFKPGDKLFFGSSFVFFSFQYYNQTNTKPLLYAPGKVSHFSGSALLFENDTIKTWPQQIPKNQIIWLINTTGFGNWQPEVPETWKLIDEKGFEDTQNRGWILVRRYQTNNK